MTVVSVVMLEASVSRLPVRRCNAVVLPTSMRLASSLANINKPWFCEQCLTLKHRKAVDPYSSVTPKESAKLFHGGNFVLLVPTLLPYSL